MFTDVAFSAKKLFNRIFLPHDSIKSDKPISLCPHLKMKVIYFLFGLAFLSLTSTQPFHISSEEHENADYQEQYTQSTETCRLANYVPKGSISIPEVDINNDEPSPAVPQDPLLIPNVTASPQEEFLSGIYSFGNGVLTGLSTFEHDVNYSPIFQRLTMNVSLQHVRLSGDYEIKDGKANLPELGEHTFSGSGPLNASAAGVKVSVVVFLRFNLTTQQVSIAKLKLNFTFDSAHIVAENLVLDEKPVDWDVINSMLKPMFDSLWPEAQEDFVQQLQERINWLLEGCTLKDLVDIFTPKPPPQQ